MKRACWRVWGTLLVALTPACEPELPPLTAEEHREAVAAWREKRIQKLTQPDGWLTLVGLFWMKDGSYTLGRDTSNNFVYAGVNGWVPSRLGAFHVQDGTARFDAAPGVAVLVQGQPVTSFNALPTDSTGPKFEVGTLQWFVIRRGGELAVRMRDAASPVRTGFTPAHIPLFDISPDWRLRARFVWHDPPDTVEIPNILGTMNPTPIPASVRFKMDGRNYELVLWKDSDDPANFFTAFADETNGGETYGGGRFIWVDAPDADGSTVIDFNRAYNPPCVFTEFATCPLPPLQNRLPFRVPAGEKMYVKH
jgi:uncharacterized protein (DUF1684 family)